MPNDGYDQSRPQPSDAVAIAGRVVSPAHPVYVIAEISGNHLQDQDRAMRLIDAAAEAGADAVKAQTYTADTMTLRSASPPFQIRGGTLWDGRTLHDVYSEASTPWEWHGAMADRAASRGIHFFSSVFDESAIELLESLDAPAYKIASAELVDLPLISAAASTGKPLIMSTGMATIAEIDDAVAAARAAGDGGVILLKCNSAYPAREEEMHLASIPVMRQLWGAPVGLSDHTVDPTSTIVGVSMGARVVEKHLTIRRSDGGPDGAFSLETEEFAALVRSVRSAEQAIGDVHFGPTRTEQASLLFRRSLFVVADVSEGEAFSTQNVRSIRPADGLPPKFLPDVMGRRATKAVTAGTPLTWDLVG